MSNDRRRRSLNQNDFDTVESSKLVGEGEKVRMSLRGMTPNSIPRYRELKNNGMLPNGTFAGWVDGLIVAELRRLEDEMRIKKADSQLAWRKVFEKKN